DASKKAKKQKSKKTKPHAQQTPLRGCHHKGKGKEPLAAKPPPAKAEKDQLNRERASREAAKKPNP
ncbi:MAG: hypothetical protein ACN6PY_01960, partial [Paraburkholderia nemoris]